MKHPQIGPLPPELQSHAGYSRVFKPGQLTFGFIMRLVESHRLPWRLNS